MSENSNGKNLRIGRLEGALHELRADISEIKDTLNRVTDNGCAAMNLLKQESDMRFEQLSKKIDSLQEDLLKHLEYHQKNEKSWGIIAVLKKQPIFAVVLGYALSKISIDTLKGIIEILHKFF